MSLALYRITSLLAQVPLEWKEVLWKRTKAARLHVALFSSANIRIQLAQRCVFTDFELLVETELLGAGQTGLLRVGRSVQRHNLVAIKADAFAEGCTRAGHH